MMKLKYGGTMQILHKLKEILFTFFVLGAFVNILCENPTFAQENRSKLKFNFQQKQREGKVVASPENIMSRSIEAISSGKISVLSNDFARQIYLSLKTGEKGYFSNNQAFYLLQNLFSIYEPIEFHSSSKFSESLTPYIAGKLYAQFKGKIEVLQVYVGYFWNGKKWEITQISIN
mgnify:CR=1 FL=1